MNRNISQLLRSMIFQIKQALHNFPVPCHGILPTCASFSVLLSALETFS